MRIAGLGTFIALSHKIVPMKFLICSVLLLSACETATQKNISNTKTDTATIVATDPPPAVKESTSNSAVIDSPAPTKPAARLALTSNALQVVNSSTGSTSEIAFGKPLDELVEMMNKIFDDKAASIGINSECGAGPLKMVVWKNGLNLIFKEQKSNGLWLFVGWYVSKPSNNTKPLQTMAGIAVGSSRADMEEAYVIKVNKSSLGYEFSTSSGLYGIFDGPGKNAKITDMWSGTTCIFR